MRLIRKICNIAGIIDAGNDTGIVLRESSGFKGILRAAITTAIIFCLFIF